MRVVLALLFLFMRFASSFLRGKHVFGTPRLNRLSMTAGAAEGDVNYKVGFMFPGQGGKA